tara:strand:- start:86574 stop:86771 length:198 start_codon:yes stop_codon:yes gene_type:complete
MYLALTQCKEAMNVVEIVLGKMTQNVIVNDSWVMHHDDDLRACQNRVFGEQQSGTSKSFLLRSPI